MKNVLKFTLVTLLGSVVMISCQKDKSPKPQSPEKMEKQITSKQMENPDNPYDRQGQMHNEFLDYMAKHIDFGTAKKMSSDDMINLAGKFYAAKNMDFGKEQVNGFSDIFSAYTKIGIGGGEGDQSDESLICKYFPALCDLQPGTCLPSFLLDHDNGGTSTERTLKFIDAVKQMETEMLANKEVTDDQKRAFLCHTAVARFSAGYWHNVVEIEKDKSPYYKPIQALALSNPVGDVATADAIGAAIGGILSPAISGYTSACFSMATAMQNMLDWINRPR